FNRRHLGDDEDVGAQIENLMRHVIVDPGNESHHCDHGSNTDHHSEQRQHRAQLVRPQRLQRNANGFEGVHELGAQSSASAADVRLQVYQPDSNYGVESTQTGSSPETESARPEAEVIKVIMNKL